MIEILLVGDELLSGAVHDENAAFIAGHLHAAGLTVRRITTVGDSPADIEQALIGTLPETRVLIVCGGLGPTADDRTAAAAACAFGRDLELNTEALHLLEARLAGFGRPLTAQRRAQALLPRGCTIIVNPIGTASGFSLQRGTLEALFLPGVPAEVRAMIGGSVIARVKELLGDDRVIAERVFKVFGLWESDVQERLCGVLPRNPAITLGYYPHYPEILLRLTGRGDDREGVLRQLEPVAQVIREQLAGAVYAEADIGLESVVGRMLQERVATLAVAESCTGGLISHLLTNVPGASRYLVQCCVVYSNRAKQELLGVPAGVLQRQGAVSQETARLMADGVRRSAGTDWGLAVTGIAGPGGGTPEKPVGTVCIALAGTGGTLAETHHLGGDREKIKRMTACLALNSLRIRLLHSVSGHCN